MATVFEEYQEKAARKKAAENLSLEEMGQQAREGTAGRRAMFEEGAQRLLEEAEKTPEEIEAASQRATAKAIAASPSKDLRTMSGVAGEAEMAGAERAAQARQQAAGSMMDVAIAAEEMGSEVEDYSAQKAEYTTARNAIIDKHKGFWDDDEDAMYAELLDYAEDPMLDPKLKEEIIREAESIRDKDWDV